MYICNIELPAYAECITTCMYILYVCSGASSQSPLNTWYKIKKDKLIYKNDYQNEIQGKGNICFCTG